jgi:hypothetical protein
LSTNETHLPRRQTGLRASDTTTVAAPAATHRRQAGAPPASPRASEDFLGERHGRVSMWSWRRQAIRQMVTSMLFSPVEDDHMTLRRI